jgi:hypothetical protein
MAGRAGRRGIDTVGHVVHCNNLFKVPTLGEYKTILGGVPQTLVSKFHISYGLVLNLLKNGVSKKDDIYAFCEKSMVRGELEKAQNGLKLGIAELEAEIEKKQASILLKLTPLEVCQQYLRWEEMLKTSVNKKRKECERAIATLKDDHKNLLKDVVAVKELDVLLNRMKTEYSSLGHNETWINTNVDSICHLLENRGFTATDDNEGVRMTMLGKIASSLAEIHPLIMSIVLVDADYFDRLDSKQLTGLFSCFTDVKIASELRASIPSCTDETLNNLVRKMRGLADTFEKAEQDLGLFTGIRYDELLMFDMIQYSMDWTDCATEPACKYFIQSVISEKGISVGDFTKAMMKVVTIAKELENVCENVFEGGKLDLLYKLRQIENLVLKYVLTSQSLYV